ncbi:lipopolysaccharide/colanic/teichoic acid biosynthesis glycosyltransferase [Aquimarina sp. MAR_2010_214]|uniref:sugar transferase n=1 Tax=Aquimarina sp. MAR_2010_214 TaxID=1250026 RepID=UPI000C702638|nr:sugar transferase [Aquimarina sp. MAR_2010_214]PKV50989.1 lipopolysaccharide/colanic/teichoic acid biosynthesis glycosyltransferase [Aquimarina sp. MAR_2010_214]
MYKLFIKRSLDFCAALSVLFFISPIFLLLIIFLALANRGKPFFVQRRPGKNEKIFSIIKFKTMNDKKDVNGELLPDKDRITSVGAFVRKTSLDEIPQLINVLKGEMSFIGPRPLLIRYLPHYKKEEQIRHSVRPGITGLAQVSGRNILNWDDRLAMDVNYVNNVSVSLDLRIVIKTIKNVLTSKDVVVDPNSIILDLDEYRTKN